jgi:tRNA (guanine37-N1)-methyltransferase
MRLDIITIFPQMVDIPLSQSLIGRAREKGLFEIKVHDLRDYTSDKHRVVDDVPYGGGPGMVLKPEPILEAFKRIDPNEKAVRILTSAAGESFDQQMALDLAARERIIVLCGHYKGVDQRVVSLAGLREVSIGDFILTGGEFAALVIADSVLRLLPGTMKDFGSAFDDSHFSEMLGPDEYTRPEIIGGAKVPEILISGHHEKIRRWRLGNALHKTKVRRHDIFARKQLTDEEIDTLNEYEADLGRMETG